MVLPRAFIQEDQLEHEIADVERMLSPTVLRLRYELGEDWSGERSVFFRITLSDEAAKRDHLLKIVDEVTNTIEHQIEPLERWGVLPYFNFRSASEQAQLKEPAWA